MNITEISLSIKNLVKGFRDDDEKGVVAWDGKLDVRPPYQREFIYTQDKQEKVIDTIIKDFPLNVFYWGTTNIDGFYELIDGQQRTMSICNFVHGKYSIKLDGQDYLFTSLPSDIQNRILDYELTIYKCEGSDDEKLEWFKTINIASEALTEQELRNAVYTGTWLSSAKQYFSKTGCPADTYGKGFVRGRTVRQELLEKVLRWVANSKNQSIEAYMAIHRNDADASALWDYYMKVIEWAKTIFDGNGFKDLDKVNWGILYNKYSKQHYIDNNGNINCYIDGVNNNYTKENFVNELTRLLGDEEVTSTVGVFDYIFSGDERKLNIRTFPDKIKQRVYLKQNGCCKHCGRHFDYEDMQADHIDPWSKGGKTVEGNCQLLCAACNAKKSNKSEKPTEPVIKYFCKNCGKPAEKGMFCQFCGTKN